MSQKLRSTTRKPFHTLTPHSCGSRRGSSTSESSSHCLRVLSGWSTENIRDQSRAVVYTQQDKTDKHTLHLNPRQTELATLSHAAIINFSCFFFLLKGQFNKKWNSVIYLRTVILFQTHMFWRKKKQTFMQLFSIKLLFIVIGSVKT